MEYRAEIEAAFGVKLGCPVSPAELPPPLQERVDEVFEFLKGRITTAREYAPAAMDYAMFRTLYHAGLRSEEATRLDRPECRCEVSGHDLPIVLRTCLTVQGWVFMPRT